MAANSPLGRLLARLRKQPQIRPLLQRRFTSVYETRAWDSTESASGLGSERSAAAVLHCVELLRKVTAEYGIRSIADVPCGDFNWMPMFLAEHPRIAYTGYDIVEPMILENRRRHARRRFKVLDITVEAPKKADLLFCKDLVNHLFERDVWAALGQMAASGSKYLMVTTNGGFDNVDLSPHEPHASRYLNLLAPPYAMPEPLYQDHYVLLWKREDVARRLAERNLSRR